MDTIDPIRLVGVTGGAMHRLPHPDPSGPRPEPKDFTEMLQRKVQREGGRRPPKPPWQRPKNFKEMFRRDI